MTQEQPKKELAFPIITDKCPVCGSTERVAQIVGEEEATKGKLPKGTPMSLLTSPSVMADMKAIMLSIGKVTVLISIFDVCANCHAVYASRIDKLEKTTDEVQQMMGIRPLPPGHRGQVLFNERFRRQQGS